MFDDDEQGGFLDGYEEGYEMGAFDGEDYEEPRKSGGCYVATCVYGSYDCPEVWTLRRYRDGFLKQHLAGRAFIRAYYAVSPTVVKWFGGYAAFVKPIRFVLDRFVRRLNRQGFRNTPYRD